MRDHDITVTGQAFAPVCPGMPQWDRRIRQCHDEHSSVQDRNRPGLYVQKAISERASTRPSLVSWSSESARLLPETRSGCVAHTHPWGPKGDLHFGGEGIADE
jgi:hypothetical protein